MDGDQTMPRSNYAFLEAMLSHVSRAGATLNLRADEVNPDALARDLAQALCALGVLTPADRDALLMALAEALINAVDYGCLGLDSTDKADDLTSPDIYNAKRREKLHDPRLKARTITLRIKLDPHRLAITIRDPGPGIAPRSSHTTDTFAPNGRGILLMKSLVDRLIVKSTPSSITLIKYRTPENVTNDAPRPAADH